MQTATFVMASLAALTSTTALVVVLVGAKKINDKGREMETEMGEVKNKVNRSLRSMRLALDDLEI